MNINTWPELSYDEAKGTYETVHLWTQIAGKIKLGKLPWVNHSWHVTLFVTPYGLTTGDIPDKDKHFQINFDFLNHRLQIITSKNEERLLDLKSLSVASCYSNVLEILSDFGIDCRINPVPNEIENPVPLDLNTEQATYDIQHISNLHQALMLTTEVFTRFRAGFIGKCSPVHFFWGGFDLAVSRFSGKPAPLHPGGIPNFPDWVAQEAYSHEVCSCGFWTGSEAFPEAAFYSYIYPEPNGYKTAVVRPEKAYYHQDLNEYILPYNEVYKASNPNEILMDFLQSTYEAAANQAGWDRGSLEKSFISPVQDGTLPKK